MINSRTADDIANNIRMIRSSHRGVIVIVEGNTDMRVYERLIDNAQCNFVPMNGKKIAIDVLKILERDNFEGFLTIVDADFCRLDNIKPNSINLLLTDNHDLETMILSSNAIDEFISEFGSESEIKKIGNSIIDLLMDCALPIGFFRWISSPAKDDLSLKFKGMNYDTFIDVKNLKVSTNNLIYEVKTNSDDFLIDDKEIKRKIESLIKEKDHYDPWQVCSGHDMVQILTIGLANIFGYSESKNIDVGVVDKTLRLTYKLSHFNKTHLYDAIKDWEKNNEPYKILA